MATRLDCRSLHDGVDDLQLKEVTVFLAIPAILSNSGPWQGSSDAKTANDNPLPQIHRFAAAADLDVEAIRIDTDRMQLDGVVA
nr:hypothetical protein CFP56_41315 [Quercus suber]